MILFDTADLQCPNAYFEDGLEFGFCSQLRGHVGACTFTKARQYRRDAWEKAGRGAHRYPDAVIYAPSRDGRYRVAFTDGTVRYVSGLSLPRAINRVEAIRPRPWTRLPSPLEIVGEIPNGDPPFVGCQAHEGSFRIPGAPTEVGEWVCSVSLPSLRAAHGSMLSVKAVVEGLQENDRLYVTVSRDDGPEIFFETLRHASADRPYIAHWSGGLGLEGETLVIFRFTGQWRLPLRAKLLSYVIPTRKATT